MLSAKQGGIKCHFLGFGMIRPGIEPRSLGSLANSLLIPGRVIPKAQKMVPNAPLLKVANFTLWFIKIISIFD